MSDPNYVVITAANSQSTNKAGLFASMGDFAKECVENGAMRVTYGSVISGRHPNALLFIQFFEDLSGFEKVMQAIPSSKPYQSIISDHSTTPFVRNVLRNVNIPFEPTLSPMPNYLVLTRARRQTLSEGGDLNALAAITGDLPIWAMMETPRGMLNAAAIAAHPLLQGMVMGTNDLAKELQVRFRPDRLPLMAGLGQCLLAAKAEGIIIVDGVYNAFKDAEGLAAECEQGRDMGFDGKTLIHPAQVDVANAAFAPSEAEIDLSRRQIAAFEEAEAAGQGVAVVDGKIVENLHVATAREILAKADAIAAVSA